ncbi:hypothetical protein Dimus_015493 [Dionaea muscipula]
MLHLLLRVLDAVQEETEAEGDSIPIIEAEEVIKDQFLTNPISIECYNATVFDETRAWKWTVGSNENLIPAKFEEMDEEQRSQQQPDSNITPIADLQSSSTPTEVEDDKSPGSRPHVILFVSKKQSNN